MTGRMRLFLSLFSNKPFAESAEAQMNRKVVLTVAVALLSWAGFAGADKAKQKPADGLRALNDLIGSWRATGTPEGTREEKQRGFWTETISWSWQFKGE